MANGDAAAAAGMDVVPPTGKVNKGYDEINKTRDYIAQRTSTVVPIAKGGTGATTAAQARTNLAVPAAADIRSDKIPRPDSSTVEQGLNATWENANARVSKAGDTITGHLFLPNAFAASSSYVVAYINGDGRVSRGSSSARFKTDIVPIDPAALGDLFPQLHSFVMKDDPGRMTRYGYIAEHLDDSDELRPFVVYQREIDTDGDGNVTGSHLARDTHGKPIPESIDFIALLLTQVAQLQQRVVELEANGGS